MDQKPPRVVLFDIGGPIDMEMAFEAAIDADIKAGLQREGFDIDDARYAAAEWRAMETCAPRVYRSVIWQLSGGDREASLRIYERMEEAAAERDLFELRPGMPVLLQRLREHGLRLGLVA